MLLLLASTCVLASLSDKHSCHSPRLHLQMNLAFRAVLRGEWWGCSPACQLRLQHAVTLHMGGRGLGDMRKGAHAAAQLMRKAACYATHLTDLEQLAGQSLRSRSGLSTQRDCL